LASLSNGNIWVLWLTYGVLGGLGLGLGYIVPLATLVKWFPDRRGFITGLAVAGFGAGALITAPVAEHLISGVGVLKTLAILGIDYLIMVVLLQAVLFFLLPSMRAFTLLALVCFIIISCYGGGFGTMLAFAADYFGTKWVGSIYGLMLTAWGFAGVFGPLLIANIRQATGSYGGALITIACILLVSSLLPLGLRRQRAAEEVVQAKSVGRV